MKSCLAEDTACCIEVELLGECDEASAFTVCMCMQINRMIKVEMGTIMG